MAEDFGVIWTEDPNAKHWMGTPVYRDFRRCAHARAADAGPTISRGRVYFLCPECAALGEVQGVVAIRDVPRLAAVA